MSKSVLAIFASACISAVSANGSCAKLNKLPEPKLMPDDQEFAAKNLTGLWFEYVWSPNFQDSLDYGCSMWTLLTDTSDEDIVVFNHMHFPENKEDSEEEKKTGSFKQFKVNFDGPNMSYTRHETREASAVQARSMHIAATDYGSFMIAASCRDEHLPEGQDAVMDWVVLTRDKQPSRFMRQKMRALALEAGAPVDSLTKGPLVACWGEDMFGK